MNELIIDDLKIEDIIYDIRGKQVILDNDLAKLYHVETKELNRQVKRNIERFPSDFMFQLTNEEYKNLRCQISTSSLIKNNYGGRRYMPYVFTEQGISMLASVLHSEIAIKNSIKIIRVFVIMKKYISNNLIEQRYINNIVLEDHDRIKKIEESFSKFEREEISEIYFDGKLYDAYSKVLDIFKESKTNLIIVDRYTDKTVLDIIKNVKCDVLLITSKKGNLTKLDIEKYNKTYNNLKVVFSDEFHDRYFIIDNKKVYHSGNSINHIGYRKSCINILNDKNVINSLLKDIKSIIENKKNSI